MSRSCHGPGAVVASRISSVPMRSLMSISFAVARLAGWLAGWLAGFLVAAEGGNAFCFADDQPTVGEGDDIDLGLLLAGPAEVELGDVLEGPGGRCQRLAGQGRHVAVLVEEFPGSCRAGHRTIAARPGRIAGQHWCRRARRTAGRCFFAEQPDPVERPPFAFAAGHDQAAVQSADSMRPLPVATRP